jgi:chloramphenicol-sensitive protein RarD
MTDREIPGSTSAGVLYALGAYGIWGIAPAYWKALEVVPATQILAHRVLWSMLVGFLLLLVTRSASELGSVLRSRRHVLPMLVSAALIGINWLTFIWAVATDRILDTSLGYYINPLINVLFGTVFLRERLRAWQIVAVLLAAVGVVQMVFSLGTLPWISLVLAVTFALYGLVRKVAPVMPVVGFTLETTLLAPLGGAYLLLVHANGSNALLHASGEVKILIACTGVFTAAPLLCFNSAAKRLRLSTIGLFQYIAPSMAFLLAVVFYGEPFTRVHAITFVCVWLALGIYTLDSARAVRGT